MEKRRRARINNCLNELKALILDATKKDVSFPSTTIPIPHGLYFEAGAPDAAAGESYTLWSQMTKVGAQLPHSSTGSDMAHPATERH